MTGGMTMKTYSVRADRQHGTLVGWRLINRKVGETVSYHLATRRCEAEAERDRLNAEDRRCEAKRAGK